MPWWSWLIISLLAILTLGFSAWYFLSIGNFWNKGHLFDWQQFFALKKPLTTAEISQLKTNHLIVLMAVGSSNLNNQTLQPLGLFKTSDIETTINHLNQQIKHRYAIHEKDFINDYLLQSEQSPAAIKYYLFRHYRNEILLNRGFSKWLIKSHLNQIGFNQFNEVFR